jgi:hypothetical protein
MADKHVAALIFLESVGTATMLVDWFMDQDVDGEPVSGNLAKAMATIIRLPLSQGGGSKRSWGRRSISG